MRGIFHDSKKILVEGFGTCANGIAGDDELRAGSEGEFVILFVLSEYAMVRIDQQLVKTEIGRVVT